MFDDIKITSYTLL